MGIPETMAVIAGTGLAVTIIVVLVRASYQLGKLSSLANNHEIAIRDLNGKVDHLDAKFEAKFDALTAAINELRDEMQQTNRILVGLANHTYDADGRTVFAIPS